MIENVKLSKPKDYFNRRNCGVQTNWSTPTFCKWNHFLPPYSLSSQTSLSSIQFYPLNPSNIFHQMFSSFLLVHSCGKQIKLFWNLPLENVHAISCMIFSHWNWHWSNQNSTKPHPTERVACLDRIHWINLVAIVQSRWTFVWLVLTYCRLNHFHNRKTISLQQYPMCYR